MFSLFGKKSSTLCVIYDIGGSSIRAGLVRIEKDKIPHIIFTAREAIPFQQIVNPQRLLSSMLDVLRTISLRVTKEGASHLKFTKFGTLRVSHVYYIFSSPWSVSEGKKILVHKEKPFVITEEYLKNLVDEQENLFKKEFSSSEDENFRKTLTVVDRQIIQVKLNGYDVVNPYGRKADRVDVSSLISLVPKDVIEKVEEVGVHGIHYKDKRAFSLSLVALSTIRDMFKDESNFLFLDITSILTDITVVKDGVMVENASFPLGKDFIVDKLSKALLLSYDVARSTYSAYVDGHIDEASNISVKKIVEDAMEEWFALFQSSLTEIAAKSFIPRTIFLIVSNTFVSFFTKAIEKEKFNQFGTNTTAFKVIVLNQDHFKDKVLFTKDIYKDPFISMESIFINKLLS